MRIVARITVLAAVLAAAVPAWAQERAGSAGAQPPKIGLGVGLSTAANGTTGSLFFVPINATPNLRVEPLIGWARSDLDAGSGFANPGDGKNSDVFLGVGAFYVAPVGPGVQLYAGPRLILEWQSFEDPGIGPGAFKGERRNTILAVALGAEYLPHPRIALGGEAMLGYISYGDTDFTQKSTGLRSTGGGGSGSFTQGTLFARFYLF